MYRTRPVIRPTLFALAMTAAAHPAFAQSTSEDHAPVDRVRVLGTHIKAPVQATEHSLSADDLDRLGVEDLTAALLRIPANIGSESNTDSINQNDTSGTANINLRGLGLDATLVMLDNTRMTVSSVAADDGSTFVDTNALVPTIAIARVDVLANGGSALYGSDAIAGVVNVITRNDFDGLELAAERRLATKYGNDASEWIVEAIAGTQGEKWSAVAAISWFDRQSLEGTDTDFTRGTGISGLGQPGAYLIQDPNTGNSVTIIDQDCTAAGGIFSPSGSPIDGLGAPGFCRLDFAQFFSLVNNEQRFSAYADITGDLGFATARLQATFADTATERGNSPSLPDLSFPTLPADNPGNYFGQDVVWFGRPRGVEAGSARRKFDHETHRIMGALEGAIEGENRIWDWSTTLAYSRNGVRTTITDHLDDRLDAAIIGLGGPDCPVTDLTSATNQGITPGDQSQGCYYFNPFGSGGLVTDPNDPRYNDPLILDHILGEDIRKGTTDLTTFDALIATPNLAATGWADFSGAIGIQARHETTATEHGEDFNAENFLFIIGGPDFSGERSATAIFGELVADTAHDVTVQLAGRFEDVEGNSAFSPRAQVAWRPTDTLTLTASASRSFRAPSLYETVSASTTLQNIRVNGQSLTRAVATSGSDTLDPETSTAFTAQAAYNKGAWRTSITLWRYDVEDLIVEESAQAIVDADLEDGTFDNPAIELSNTGELRRVNANFVNAPQVTTQGVDFAVERTLADVMGGDITAGITGTYTHEYTFTDPVSGDEFSAEGNRNFSTFVRSVPQWRSRTDITWTKDTQSLSAAVNYTSGYRNNQRSREGDIDQLVTIDAQYATTLDTGLSQGTDLQVGVIDALNHGPPMVDTQLGYDTKIHDPRGRIIYARLSQKF